MKTGRGHAVLTGIWLGLAGGVCLGTYILAPHLPAGSAIRVGSIAAERDAAREDVAIAQAQSKSADAIIDNISAAAVREALIDRGVLILATAEADKADVEAMRALLDQAGAGNSGTIYFTEKFFDQAGADSLKNTVTLTLPAGAQLSVDKLDPGTHAGESLGSTLMFEPVREGTEEQKPQASPEERAIVLGALKEAGFINYEDGSISPAHVAVLLTGDNPGSTDDNFTVTTQAAFAEAIDARAGGLVVAGRVHAASDTGLIGVLRSNPSTRSAVSTVDSIDRTWAKIATVLALKEQLRGSSGAYGAAASADAASPAPRIG
ncbi:copper transporter [Corynebacterium sp. ES2794-CONJ1]|uniref:copper transporter n=1 Tax=unclassified Corynebacterium TaxID=2624378 RepID=UPI00216A5086|nr:MULTISPECIES: copper transporter [unclassified Corynebacterium]MCS4489410.1 copper transporter [Corynebacterium sp. ES2775-CONJ]MCS4491221.1 copper transporter [Corynebacterium sp. ES2715-CONJ3]MCS4530898.1 copper transporter [Corynebacterium sp. ES2730-CONJ]MCU9518263.1 copper transporter [Corynebacterium sp. ES2794-CONJ1]